VYIYNGKELKLRRKLQTKKRRISPSLPLHIFSNRHFVLCTSYPVFAVCIGTHTLSLPVVLSHLNLSFSLTTHDLFRFPTYLLL